jgi:hypothetical protein
MKKRWIILSVFLIFALSACASRSSQQAAEGPAAVAPAVEESKDAYMNQTAGSVGEQSAREAVERLVIKQAYMRVSVADPAAAMRSVMSMAEGMDGYVVSSNQWNSVDSSGKEYAQTSITIRVPSERLDEAMQNIRDLAADPKMRRAF